MSRNGNIYNFMPKDDIVFTLEFTIYRVLHKNFFKFFVLVIKSGPERYKRGL